MKKKKLLIIVVVLLMLITSFFVLTKKPKIKYKKLKELNYNLTYKQAFPDENLRRGVVLCIMRNYCDTFYKRYYEYNYYKNNDYGSLYETKEYVNKKWSWTTAITESEIEAKENETISKVDLDKIKFLIPNDRSKEITTLEGIQYLINLEYVILENVKEENVDFSNNKELISLFLNGKTETKSQIKTINLDQNTKLKVLFFKLSNKNLNLSNVTALTTIDIKKTILENIVLPNSVTNLELSDNNIKSINIPTSAVTVNLDRNELDNIDLSNSPNLEELHLKYMNLYTINLTKLPKLKILDIASFKSAEDIDFSKNTNLEKLYINEGRAYVDYPFGNIDLSNNLNLKEISYLYSEYKTLNIEKNVNLEKITLSNVPKDDVKMIDIRKYPKVKQVLLAYNHYDRVYGPTEYINDFQGLDWKRIKVKKNSYVTIPKVYFDDREVYLKDSPNFTRNGETYVFNKLGDLNEIAIGTEKSNPPFIYHYFKWEYNIEVEAGEEETFNPVFNQGNYTPLINEEIPVNNLKEMITNLPANIKNFEVLSSNTFTEKGDKTIKVRITFSDDTFKEVDIPVKVYEKEDILPTVTVTPETLEVIEKKPVNINIARSYAKEDNIDPTNFIKTVRDNLVSYEYLNKANGLTYNSNSVTGVIEYLFTGNEEEHTFNITYKEKGNIYTFNKNISIKLLRDTDKDGIADKNDDDKDGDGFNNDLEILKGSDPYNKNSLPDMSKKDELDNLVKQLEKLIDDTKNNPFDNKNKLDVDNLKNNFLPSKVTEKDNIKGSYSATTSDTELLKLIEKTKKEINDIKKEINKLRDKANFEELDKEINKEVDNSYKELIDKIKEAKDLDRNTTTQEEVDKITKEIKDLREKIVTDKEELKKKIEELEKAISDKLCKSEECKKLLKEAKDLYDKDFILKEDMFNMIKRIDDLLDKEKRITNPNTGIKTYSLLILVIIFISYLVFKKKKKVYFKN